MPLIIALVLAFVAGFGLQRLIGSGISPPSKPTDYGRIWSGWVVWAATFYLLTGFLMRFDAESFFTWIVVTPFYGGVAFAAGCAYGKIFRTSSPHIKPAQQKISARSGNRVTLSNIPVKKSGYPDKSISTPLNRKPYRSNYSSVSQTTTRPTVTAQEGINMTESSLDKGPPMPEREIQDNLYEKAWDEVESGNTLKPLWARVFAECDGDLEKTKARYIKYRAIELGAREQIRQTSSVQSFINFLDMTFNLIPAGTFMMGHPGDDPESLSHEARYQVTLTKAYYIQTSQLTQKQWKKIMGDSPSHFSNCGDNCPVEGVSWNDVQAFIRKLSSMDNQLRYRLPTDAEWEFAARAGSTTQFCFGDNEDRLGDYAWYEANSKDRVHPVGLKKPNAWGLYDMHGNVWEWCSDWYGDYLSGIAIDPKGPPSGSNRVLRGGSWSDAAWDCRSASRGKYEPEVSDYDLGFRLVAASRSVS